MFLTPDDRGAAFIDRNRIEIEIKKLIVNKK